MYPRHLYVHVPFCARRCTYCDFSIAVRARTPVDEYLEALRRELSVRYPDRGPWEVDTIYLGGGTPSRLGAAGVARLLDSVRERATPATGAEITLEANPEDVNADAVRGWLAAGITRVSLGVQSFDDDVLRWMHRVHDAGGAVRAVETLQACGIEDLSIDLIFALPELLRRGWRADVERTIAFAPTHVSLYGLTVEAHTPLGRWRDRGEVTETPEERYEDEYLVAHELLSHAGFEHYEVSNFGRPGRHARHNGAYWRTAAYAGLGPSAHEFDGARRRRWNVAPYAEWVRRLASGLDPVGGEESLTDDSLAIERVYLGLRTTDGLQVTSAERATVMSWVQTGWGRVDGADRLVLSPLGWLRLDTLARALTALRSH